LGQDVVLVPIIFKASLPKYGKQKYDERCYQVEVDEDGSVKK